MAELERLHLGVIMERPALERIRKAAIVRLL